MKALVCEMCGSNDVVKQDGLFVCQHCGTKYSVEEARKMMIECTVKIDNSELIEKCFTNARRAYSKEDWQGVEKYYNIIEQDSPNNIEALFFSAYGKAMLALTDSDYFKREQKFEVLIKSISVISEYYEISDENKETVLKTIADAIIKMTSVKFVYNKKNSSGIGSMKWQKSLFIDTLNAFITELKQISATHDDEYIKKLIKKMNSMQFFSGGCYIATAVYGSYDCPQVWTLRRYRDLKLCKTICGRKFISIYYTISPTLVKWFGETKWFKYLWKNILDIIVTKLQKQGFKDTPYNDRQW